jgi:hypothetical protein
MPSQRFSHHYCFNVILLYCIVNAYYFSIFMQCGLTRKTSMKICEILLQNLAIMVKTLELWHFWHVNIKYVCIWNLEWKYTKRNHQELLILFTLCHYCILNYDICYFLLHSVLKILVYFLCIMYLVCLLDSSSVIVNYKSYFSLAQRWFVRCKKMCAIFSYGKKFV